MQAHGRKVLSLGVMGVAAAVLATGAAGGAKTPSSTQPVSVKQFAQLVPLQADRDGGDTYVWMVDGVQRGMAFR